MAALVLATVGGKVKASIVNAIIAVLSPATTYTPTISNWTTATTPPTTTGRYWRTGNMVHVLVQTKLGTGAATVGAVSVSLPIAMDTTGMIASSTMLAGTSSFSDVSVGAGAYFMGGVRYLDANTVQPMRPSTASAGVVGTTSSTLPFTWATLDEMSLYFSYPVLP